MHNKFDTFIENIPKNIHSDTKSYIGNNIAVFLPEDFVTKQKMLTTDYHFVIFQSTPPPIALDDLTIQFKSHMLMSLQPGIQLYIDPDFTLSNIRFISICIKKDMLESLAYELTNKKIIKFKSIENSYNYQLLDSIGAFISEINNYHSQCLLMLESIETQIAIQLLRDSLPEYMYNKNEELKGNKSITQALEYMKKYYSSNIGIRDISNEVFLSPCYFQRLFKECLNETPYRYLMLLRIEKSIEMLELGRMSIEEIAKNCGFISTSHYSTVFRRVKGVSPSTFKKGSLQQQ